MLHEHDNKLFDIAERLEAQYYEATHEWLRALLLRKRFEAVAISTVSAMPAHGTQGRS
jgi:hypothetical protein